jgi:hypothetical protein
MAEPTASIWDVTRMILGSPGSDPAAIAAEHGFTVAEVAEMLPLFLDNVRVDFSLGGEAEVRVPPAEPAPGENDAAFLERYLRSLGQAVGVDIVPYQGIGGRVSGPPDAPVPDPEPVAPDLGPAPAFGAGQGPDTVTGEPEPGEAAAEDNEPPVETPGGEDGLDPAPEDEAAEPGDEPPDEVSDTDFQFD